jgi:hypothetical protein
MYLADVSIESSWPLAKIVPFQTLGGLIGYLLPKALIIGGVICFIVIIITGVGIIATASSGDAHAAESRKNVLTYALVGLIIMLGSYWILQFLNFITKGAFNSILGQ